MQSIKIILSTLFIMLASMGMGQTLPSDQHSITAKSKRFSVGLSSGYGFLIGNSDDSRNELIRMGLDPKLATEYYKEYRNSLLTGLSFQYNIVNTDWLTFGAGLSYTNTSSGSKKEGRLDPQDGVNYLYGIYSEDIYTNLYAFLLRFSFYPDRKKITTIFMESSQGLLSYRNEMIRGSDASLLTGQTLGFDSKIGFGVMIFKNTWVDLSGGITGGMMRHFTLRNAYTSTKISFPENQFESLLKLSMQLGVSYKF